MFTRSLLALALSASALGAQAAPTPGDDTLYSQLGAQPGLVRPRPRAGRRIAGRPVGHCLQMVGQGVVGAVGDVKHDLILRTPLAHQASHGRRLAAAGPRSPGLRARPGPRRQTRRRSSPRYAA